MTRNPQITQNDHRITQIASKFTGLKPKNRSFLLCLKIITQELCNLQRSVSWDFLPGRAKDEFRYQCHWPSEYQPDWWWQWSTAPAGLLVLPLAITWSMLGLNHRRNRELKTLEVIWGTLNFYDCTANTEPGDQVVLCCSTVQINQKQPLPLPSIT